MALESLGLDPSLAAHLHLDVYVEREPLRERARARARIERESERERTERGREQDRGREGGREGEYDLTLLIKIYDI